ncbi:hypothetical protein CRUP_037593 [Coryphaenoides rupestris]|nr:hypothetical protein CRUP_037593 [Coryphaenoides rupestris]
MAGCLPRILSILIILGLSLLQRVDGNEEVELIRDLFKGYTKQIRPVEHPEDKLQVQIKLTLTNLISLNEKEETLTTNVWIEIRIDKRYSPDDLEYQEIIYNLIIKRKPLFYIINVILPISLISSLVVLAYFLPAQGVDGNEEVELIRDLFKGYTKQIRPVEHPEDKLQVQIKLTLTNLISLNEKEETLTTNVWIEIVRLRKPCIHIVYRCIYIFDHVLMQNTSCSGMTPVAPGIDGNFGVAYYANVLISSSGWMYWLPPAIYRSTCAIEITYFPFDYQNCSLIFSPDDLEYQEIIYNLIIKRKPLFYIINVILPISLISSLVVLAYFLPAQVSLRPQSSSPDYLLPRSAMGASQGHQLSGTPPPLQIHRYIIFVMCVTTLIATNQIVVFLELVPRFLGMAPLVDDTEVQAAMNGMRERRRSSFGLMQRAEDSTANLYKSLAKAAPEIKQCVDACNFIAESKRQQNDIGSVCFWVALLLFSLGTVAIFLTGHFNQVPEFPFPGLARKFEPGKT